MPNVVWIMVLINVYLLQGIDNLELW